MIGSNNIDKYPPIEDHPIFDRLRSGDAVSMTDPDYSKINDVVVRTHGLIRAMDLTHDAAEIRQLMGAIVGEELHEQTTIFGPIHINFGRHIKLGNNVFINHGCSMLDMGGIAIGDNSLIGPQVKLITENHPLDPAKRHYLVAQPITIKENVWIGAGATILPGVTIGQNAVVAAGAVVSKDVPANTVVGGVPAKVLKTIDHE